MPESAAEVPPAVNFGLLSLTTEEIDLLLAEDLLDRRDLVAGLLAVRCVICHARRGERVRGETLKGCTGLGNGVYKPVIAMRGRWLTSERGEPISYAPTEELCELAAKMLTPETCQRPDVIGTLDS